MMKIIQITDLHIGKEGEDTFGVDVRNNFLRTLKMAQVLKPDYLIVSGDLCYQVPAESIYEWVKQCLEDSGLPYDLLSGNHDDPGMMAKVFGRESSLKEGELYFVRQLDNRPLLCLDTTTGVVSDAQLAWLEERLKEQSDETLLFMHHPPMLSRVPHMDRKYALRNREAVQNILFKFNFPIHIFAGHYHVDKTVYQKNVMIYITPACFFQIDQHSEEFRVDHRRPGLREIVLEDGKIMTTVKYLCD
jgi:Icc protein